MELALRFNFDAAHRFDMYPEAHAYSALHGHSFQVEVGLEGEPDAATGMVADLGEVERACAAVRNLLDHRLLNDVPGLEKPSLENLCLFVWNALQPRFPQLARVTVRRDSIGQSCTYKGR